MTWLLVTYAVCAVFNYSASLAHVQREYPMLAKEDAANDVLFALLLGLVGPLGTPGVLLNCRVLRHGFMLWPEETE